jgi:hypothetical protein
MFSCKIKPKHPRRLRPDAVFLRHVSFSSLLIEVRSPRITRDCSQMHSSSNTSAFNAFSLSNGSWPGVIVFESRVSEQEGNGEPRQIILMRYSKFNTQHFQTTVGCTQQPWRHPPDGMGAERWSAPPCAGAGHLSGPIRPHDQKDFFSKGSDPYFLVWLQLK